MNQTGNYSNLSITKNVEYVALMGNKCKSFFSESTTTQFQLRNRTDCQQPYRRKKYGNISW